MIAFYVHHHGRGHLNRSAAVIEHLTVDALVMSSIDPGDTSLGSAAFVALPYDARDQDVLADPTAGGALHWAPRGSDLLRERAALMTQVLEENSVQLLVSDASAETALLGRLCGVPVVSVRSHGKRTDRAHQLGYDVSAALIAPFPEIFEPLDTPTHIRRRTFHCGFVTSSDQRRISRAAARSSLGITHDANVLLIVVGGGGSSFRPSTLPAICNALPGWVVVFAGKTSPMTEHERLRPLGWSDDIPSWMAAADVVAGHAGANVVAEVASSGRPFICVAEERPFGEQSDRMVRLGQIGAATTRSSWPSPAEWAPAISAAMELGGERLHSLFDSGGAMRAARWLERRHAGDF